MRINPAMIALGRESRGWTQAQLGKAIGVTKPTVCKYELGLLSAERDIQRIADVLDYHPVFFTFETRIFGLGGDFLYRKRAHVSASVKRRVQAEINIVRMQCERLLASADVSHELPFPAIQPEERSGRIEQIAREVRSAWKLRPGPISNVTTLIENAGAVIIPMDFGTLAIDGTNMRMPGAPPLLFLNRLAPGDRHRWNTAHELGHSVMHFGQTFGDAENEANRFASEFLMPKKDIRADLANIDLPAAARLKAVWGVSMAALIRRARDLNAITDSTYRRLFTVLSANEMRMQEPFPIQFEQPTAFERLKEVHRRDIGLDDSEMRNLLFTDQLGPLDARRSPKLRISDGDLFNDPSDS